MHECVLHHVWLFVTPWSVAHQAPLSMVILQVRIREWVAISYHRGIFLTQESNPHLLHWQVDSLSTNPWEQPNKGLDWEHQRNFSQKTLPDNIRGNGAQGNPGTRAVDSFPVPETQEDTVLLAPETLRLWWETLKHAGGFCLLEKDPENWTRWVYL